MGFAATLLPKVLLPSDGETEEVAYEVKYMMGIDPAHDPIRTRGFTFYVGRESYIKFHEELDKVIAKYHGRKTSR